MSRTTTTKKTITKPRNRKPKVGEAALLESAAEQYEPKELELRSKYPNHNILPQSYRVSGGREGWGAKHTVEIRCALAGEGCTATEPRIVATSDLQFETTRFCQSCSKVVKANRRRTRTAKKELS